MPSGIGPSRSGGNLGGIAVGGTAYAQYDLRELQTLGREMSGRIGKAPTQVRAAHRDMALASARVIAATLARSIAATGRQQRSEATLVNLLLDERAVDASSDGWVVGRAGFFEGSKAAPYYRNLEEGTRIFVGRELRGFFRSEQGGTSGPKESRIRKDSRLIQTGKFYAGTKESKQELKQQKTEGRFRPGLQTYGRTLKKPSDKKGRGFKIIIKNPIPAYHYFRRGGATFMRSGVVQDIYNRRLKGLPGFVPIPR